MAALKIKHVAIVNTESNIMSLNSDKYLALIHFEMAKKPDFTLEDIQPYFGEYIDKLYNTNFERISITNVLDIIIDKLPKEERSKAAAMIRSQHSWEKNKYSIKKKIETIPFLSPEQQIKEFDTLFINIGSTRNTIHGYLREDHIRKITEKKYRNQIKHLEGLKRQVFDLAHSAISNLPENKKFLATIGLIKRDEYNKKLPALKKQALSQIKKVPIAERFSFIIEKHDNNTEAIKLFKDEQKENFLRIALDSVTAHPVGEHLGMTTKLYKLANYRSDIKDELSSKILENIQELKGKLAFDTALETAPIFLIEKPTFFGHKEEEDYRKPFFTIAMNAVKDLSLNEQGEALEKLKEQVPEGKLYKNIHKRIDSAVKKYEESLEGDKKYNNLLQNKKYAECISFAETIEDDKEKRDALYKIWERVSGNEEFATESARTEELLFSNEPRSMNENSFLNRHASKPSIAA